MGGGIRDLETIEAYLSSGVGWVILGTAALRSQELVRDACARFPGRIILSIDAKGGNVAIQGWYEVVALKVFDLSRQFEETGLSAIIFTDVERDGMGTGLNWKLTRRLAQSTSIPVIASGGISRIGEIERLMKLEPEGSWESLWVAPSIQARSIWKRPFGSQSPSPRS